MSVGIDLKEGDEPQSCLLGQNNLFLIYENAFYYPWTLGKKLSARDVHFYKI